MIFFFKSLTVRSIGDHTTGTLMATVNITTKSFSDLQMEAESPNEEDYKQLLEELEQQKKERAGEVKELIDLRWRNACLRHELIRLHEQQRQQQNEEGDRIELEFEGGGGGIIHYDSEQELEESPVEHHDDMPCFGAAPSDGSKRRKLLRRLKRWVEGSEKTKEKDRHSVTYEAQVPARRSCSSA